MMMVKVVMITKVLLTMKVVMVAITVIMVFFLYDGDDDHGEGASL